MGILKIGQLQSRGRTRRDNGVESSIHFHSILEFYLSKKVMYVVRLTAVSMNPNSTVKCLVPAFIGVGVIRIRVDMIPTFICCKCPAEDGGL